VFRQRLLHSGVVLIRLAGQPETKEGLVTPVVSMLGFSSNPLWGCRGKRGQLPRRQHEFLGSPGLSVQNLSKLKKPQAPLTPTCCITEMTTACETPAGLTMASQLGNPITASERMFEMYLSSNGYTGWTHEQPTLGKPTTPDYHLRFGHLDLYFDVKEFENDDPVHHAEDGAYDPYRRLREKVNQAARQFKHYREFSCSLVLSDPNAARVDIDAPEIVIGTMFGNIGFSVPFGDSADPRASARRVFTTGGKMVDYKHGTAWNTTFSSIISLVPYPVRRKRLLIARDKRKREAGRELMHEEWRATAKSVLTTDEDTVVRIVVYENPYARIPLPATLFRGPFDERWGADGDLIRRVFVGDLLAELETELVQCDLRTPIQRFMDRQQQG